MLLTKFDSTYIIYRCIMSKFRKKWEAVDAESKTDTTSSHIDEAMGPGYYKGLDLARSFEEHVKAGDLADYRPPIFAIDASVDQGEVVGFGAYFGLPPGEALNHLAEIIPQQLNIQVELVTVTDEADLLPTHDGLHERDFMSERLPAVRIVPVLPESLTIELPEFPEVTDTL